MFTINDLLQRLLADVPPERPNSAAGGGEKSIVDLLCRAVAEHSQSGANMISRPAEDAKKVPATFAKSSPPKRQHFYSMSVDQPLEFSAVSAPLHKPTPQPRAKEAPAEISLAVHQLFQAHT